MGIPVYETENAANYYDNNESSYASSCSCSCSCSASTTSATTSKTQQSSTDRAHSDCASQEFPSTAKIPNTSNTNSTFDKQNSASKKSSKAKNSQTPKNLVGNCKEFRIENNTHNLRIIGNDNRIRIIRNFGNLQVIGNSTRLKIVNNSGDIAYTGNDGRISLGDESSQQIVDYIGCNGILKVKTTTDMNCKRTEQNKKNTKKATTVGAAAAATAATATPTPRKVKVKSASYGGACNNSQWQQFSELFNISMPNLKHLNAKTDDCKTSNNNNKHCHYNVVKNIGSIVINNAVNVQL